MILLHTHLKKTNPCGVKKVKKNFSIILDLEKWSWSWLPFLFCNHKIEAILHRSSPFLWHMYSQSKHLLPQSTSLEKFLLQIETNLVGGTNNACHYALINCRFRTCLENIRISLQKSSFVRESIAFNCIKFSLVGNWDVFFFFYHLNKPKWVPSLHWFLFLSLDELQIYFVGTLASGAETQESSHTHGKRSQHNMGRRVHIHWKSGIPEDY